MKIDDLPETIAELAWERAEEVDMASFNYSDDLGDAFDWSKTPEGFEFWEKVYQVYSTTD